MPYTKKKATEPQSILKNRQASTMADMTAEHAKAIAGLVISAIRNNNAVYLQPGRYNSLTFKVYIEGDQFAEALVLDNQLDDLSEQIIDALYTKDDVAWCRRAFGTAPAELPATPSKAPKP